MSYYWKVRLNTWRRRTAGAGWGKSSNAAFRVTATTGLRGFRASGPLCKHVNHGALSSANTEEAVPGSYLPPLGFAGD